MANTISKTIKKTFQYFFTNPSKLIFNSCVRPSSSFYPSSSDETIQSNAIY